MESADLVLVLVVVAIGAFAGGILFGMWLTKRGQMGTMYRIRGENLPSGGKINYGNPPAGWKPPATPSDSAPISGKFQPTAPNRIGWPALRRELEEDDPEAKRYEEIVKANGGN